jgi:hypothetical protein
LAAIALGQLGCPSADALEGFQCLFVGAGEGVEVAPDRFVLLP